MKKVFLVLCCMLTCEVFSQEGFRYQVKLNMIPVRDFQYAGGGRIGVETIERKYNFGIDLLTYMIDDKKSEIYWVDSVIHRTRIREEIYAKGIAFNVSRAIQFKGNKNKWIFGCQAFAGINRQNDYSQQEVYDTIYRFDPRTRRLIPSDIEWISIYQEDRSLKHGFKASFAVAIFARMELAINKRFTFSPEFQIPVYMNNFIGGEFSSECSPGFNFCLGYKFAKGS